MKEIFIRDEFIRLDSALKFCGVVGTGGQAKILIQDGFVTVNDEVCTMRGKKLRSGDKIKFEDNIFVIKNEG